MGNPQGSPPYSWLPRPPYWELGEVARQLLRHYTAAILPAFPRAAPRLRRVVARLAELQGSGRTLVRAVREVVEVAGARGGYGGAVEVARGRLAQLRHLGGLVAAPPAEDHAAVEELFQETWQFMAAHTVALAAAFHVDCDLPAASLPAVKLSGESAAGAALPALLAAVTGLWEAMADSLAAGAAAADMAPDVAALHARLVGLRAATGLENCSGAAPVAAVTALQLGRWLREPAHKEAVAVGLDQLHGIRDTLVSCAARQEDM